MTIKRLATIPQSRAYVRIFESGRAVLVSEGVEVAELTPARYLYIAKMSPVTTRRHIFAFCQEYCGADYNLAKQLYNIKMSMNIDTGELVDMS